MAHSTSDTTPTYRSGKSAVTDNSRQGNSFLSICLSVLIMASFPLMSILTEAEKTTNWSPIYLGVTFAANAVDLIHYIHEEHAFDLGELDKSPNRALLPNDIPLTNNPITERIEIAEKFSIHQRLDDSQREALTKLNAGFTENGWSLVAEAKLSTGDVQQWRNGTYACQVQVQKWVERAEQKLECWQFEPGG